MIPIPFADLDTPLDEAIIEATVLIGLVPNGLFVSIAIAYALAAGLETLERALVQLHQNLAGHLG